jgi:SAM-dependent methyltransferase
VIGVGNVGAAAARTAAALGARVSVLTRTEAGAESYRTRAPRGTRVVVNTPPVLARLLAQSDLVIGAILISIFDTPPMISETELAGMRPGAVIVDATCGCGPGYLPTAGPVQTPGSPPHIVNGVLHVKLDILPALVPRTASHAYTTAAAPYLLRLARHVLTDTADPAIVSACIAREGVLTHPVCQQHAGFHNVGSARMTPPTLAPTSATASTSRDVREIVEGYRARAPFARAESAVVRRPRLLRGLLRTARHVAELPCGAGHFLADYALVGVEVTMIDASSAMLAVAVDHAAAVGLAAGPIHTQVRFAQDLGVFPMVDLVVMPNAALNQLACQTPLADLLAGIRAALMPGVDLLAQVLCSHAGGELDSSGFYDPRREHGVWFADRALHPSSTNAAGSGVGVVLRYRRQHRDRQRVRVEFDYRDAQGAGLHATSVELRVFSVTELAEALLTAGFEHLRLLLGQGGLSEMLATARGGSES